MWNKESPEERCEGRGTQLESPHTCGTLITHVYTKSMNHQVQNRPVDKVKVLK